MIKDQKSPYGNDASRKKCTVKATIQRKDIVRQFITDKGLKIWRLALNELLKKKENQFTVKTSFLTTMYSLQTHGSMLKELTDILHNRLNNSKVELLKKLMLKHEAVFLMMNITKPIKSVQILLICRT